MIQQGDVVLDPSYQRDVVWPEVKMIMLIQSLFLVRCQDPSRGAAESQNR